LRALGRWWSTAKTKSGVHLSIFRGVGIYRHTFEDYTLLLGLLLNSGYCTSCFDELVDWGHCFCWDGLEAGT
jgi:hypothetical protein